MNTLKEKYAKVLLENCLQIEKGQPLFISCEVERIDFVRIIEKEALKLGVTDIYFEMIDTYLKHEALKYLEVEDLKKLTFWNKKMWNTYAKKNAAFLILTSETPGIMKDIAQDKLNQMTRYVLKTRKEFEKLRDKSKIAWTIAAVPTKSWAQELWKDDRKAEEKLWELIFKVCYITDDNPQQTWNNKIKKLESRAEKLNQYQFKKLHYQSSNGTDFFIGLPKNHIWSFGYEKLQNGKKVLVNFPTEEIFTSPDCKTAEGVVLSSKPLLYQDNIINEFKISFKKGCVTKVEAKEGEETLKNLIGICKNANRLGEVALVPYDSPISNTNQIFLETLLDENASCHLALGDSFPECIEDGINKTKSALQKEYKLNKCDSHVDFMIGTKDLNITGITEDKKEVSIFINGNFTEEFQ